MIFNEGRFYYSSIEWNIAIFYNWNPMKEFHELKCVAIEEWRNISRDTIANFIKIEKIEKISEKVSDRYQDE